MRRFLLVLALLLPSTTAAAKTINVEFEFTPYTGDAAKSDSVDTVPGQAWVFLNNVPIATQTVSKQSVPVMFDDREIAAAVWVPTVSAGSVLRKGKNTIRFEFDATDAKAAYAAQLRWASVTDHTTETGDASHGTSTNQAGEGVESKKAKGKVVFEREFVADFAADQPWHHYPAVTALSDEEKQNLTALVAQRIATFKPDFTAAYALLKGNRNLDIPAMRKSGCLEKAYAAGVRIATVPSDKLEFATTASAAIVVQNRLGDLYSPVDPAVFTKIKGDDAQMCASVALSGVFPPRLVMVRSPAGAWEVVP